MCQGKKWQQALNEYNNAIALDPNFTKAYRERGVAYFILGDYQKAITDFDKAIAHDPNYAEGYLNRRQGYYKLGNTNRACEDSRRACGLGDCKGLNVLKKKDIAIRM